MHRVLGAIVAISNHGSGTSQRQSTQLLASSCRLLSLTSPELVSATSVSVAVSSLEQAGLLAEAANELAAAHHLIAAVQLGNHRFRVRFLRLPGDSGFPSGQ